MLTTPTVPVTPPNNPPNNTTDNTSPQTPPTEAPRIPDAPSVVPMDERELNESVGSRARRGVVALLESQTIGEALAALRTADLSDEIVYFYAVDAEHRLVGVVPTRRLLMSRSYDRISEIMIHDVVSVFEGLSVREACTLLVNHRLLALPVVDSERRLVGAVDVSLFTGEMAGISARRSAENVFQLIGIHVARPSATPWHGFTDRFPWLMCNICGGLACAVLTGRYEKFLDQTIVLALFIPIVLTLSESVSIQSMSITLQGLDRAKIDWRMILRCLRTEFFTSILLGGAAGAIVAGVSLIWKRQLIVSAAIGGSIWCAVVTACLLGVLLPTIVRMFGRDPKIAAGPVVLATADVATLLFYFNLASLILHR
jgi:magnesium transporter